MSKVKPITAEEYVKVIDWAKQGMLPSLVSRVLLTLAGAWCDVHEFLPEAVSHIESPSGKNAADLIDNHLNIIAEGRGLPVPVDGEPQPCPECGGSKKRKEFGNPDDDFESRIIPCPTCQGEGR